MRFSWKLQLVVHLCVHVGTTSIVSLLDCVHPPPPPPPHTHTSRLVAASGTRLSSGSSTISAALSWWCNQSEIFAKREEDEQRNENAALDENFAYQRRSCGADGGVEWRLDELFIISSKSHTVAAWRRTMNRTETQWLAHEKVGENSEIFKIQLRRSLEKVNPSTGGGKLQNIIFVYCKSMDSELKLINYYLIGIPIKT